MSRIILSFVLGIALTSCASTKSKEAVLEVRPAEITQTKFDPAQALVTARELGAAGHKMESYKAYGLLLLRAPKDYSDRDATLLEYADIARRLGGSDEKYYGEAQAAYELISAPKDLTKPQNTEFSAGKALLAAATGADDLETKLHKALALNNDDVRLWNALGRYHDGRKDWLSAQDSYVSALMAAHKTGKHQASAVNNLGMSFLNQGRLDEARSKFVQAATMDGDNVVYDNNRRLTDVLAGDLDAAFDGVSSERAAIIYNDSGVIAERMGNTARARRYYKQAVTKSPIYFQMAALNLARIDGE